MISKKANSAFLKKPLIIIKLGGSVITFKKNGSAKTRINVIKRLAYEISTIHKDYQVIIVHGGGSFGHNLAKKYELIKGLKNESSIVGLSKLLQSMHKLNLKIIDQFERLNLAAVSLPPHSFIIQNKGKLINLNTNVIEEILKLGFIPVLYGDGVIDANLGCSIISGDTIATYLGKKLKAKRVIFLSDVDGVFSDDPKSNPKAKLILEINNKNFHKVLSGIKSTSKIDVTGEMAGKISSIKSGLKKTKVTILNGHKNGVLEKAVSGQKLGTSLYFN